MSLIFEVDKFPFKAQTSESFINLQPFNGLSKCKVAMLKVRCQEGMVLNKEAFMTSQRMLESPLARGLQNENLNSENS